MYTAIINETLCMVGTCVMHCAVWQHLADVNKIVIEDNLDQARQLPGRRILRHLLHAECLVVPIDREAVLCLQGVAIFVLWGGGSVQIPS